MEEKKKGGLGEGDKAGRKRMERSFTAISTVAPPSSSCMEETTGHVTVATDSCWARLRVLSLNRIQFCRSSFFNGLDVCRLEAPPLR